MPGPVSRRTVLQTLTGTATATTMAHTGRAEVSPTTVSFTVDYLYVWDEAQALAQSPGSRDAFFRQANALNVSHVFLSWDALQSVPDKTIQDLIYAFQRRDIQVHLTVAGRGPADITTTFETVLDQIADWEMDYQSFFGLHLHLKPRRDTGGGEALANFLSLYAEKLTLEGTHGFTLSVVIAPWWAAQQDNLTALRDNSMVSFVVVMPYADTTRRVRKRLRRAMMIDDTFDGETKWSETPYVVAVEYGNIPDESASFREEGLERAGETLADIRQNPPKPLEFHGTCLHHYGAL